LPWDEFARTLSRIGFNDSYPKEEKMSEKDVYQQKLKAQLFERKTDVENLKAKFAGARMIANPELSQLIGMLENKINKAEEKLAELEVANEGSWMSIKAEADAIWESISSSLTDISSKFDE
jgi:hypothetical protein